MSPKHYNWIANGALALAIASAFLYDSGKVPNTIAVGVGVMAGVLAVALYFWNQHKEVRQEISCAVTAKEEPVQKAKRIKVTLSPRAEAEISALQESSAKIHHYVDASVLLQSTLQHRLHRDILVARHHHWHNPIGAKKWMELYTPPAVYSARQLRYSFPKDMRLMTPEVELSPRETANCVIEIMRTLAIQDMLNECEYVFDEKGLRVTMKSAPPKNLAPQGHFVFDGFDELAENNLAWLDPASH